MLTSGCKILSIFPGALCPIDDPILVRKGLHVDVLGMTTPFM